MRTITAIAVMAFVAVATNSYAADKTWTGKISDSMCGAKHASMGEHAAKMSDKECTDACVKKGASRVFVSGSKVYKLTDSGNMTAGHEGHTVRLTGTMSGDTITVAKVAMPPTTKKK